MIYLLILGTVIVGSLMPVQASINAELTRFLKNPFLGALISFTMGTIALTILSLINGAPIAELKRLTSVSPVLLIGGLLGAIFVGSSIFFIPKLGATTMIAGFITGQLLMSVCIDHFGLFGVPTTPLASTRIIGITLLFCGLYLIMRKPA